MPINSNLNFYVNAAFSLSDDRTKLYELSSKADKANNNKHKWNELLLAPLVENLFSMIKYATSQLSLANLNQIVETFWPIENKLSFFISFEKLFYKTICDPKHTNASILPYINGQAYIQLSNINECLFIDFDLESTEIQMIAIKILKERMPKMNFIQLPSLFLNEIKLVENK
jgi:hypothetical protein